jgi:hypothetical protein
VAVRSRHYLVEEVTLPSEPWQQTLVRLSCLDDDAQGTSLQVPWEKEVDARILAEGSWRRNGKGGFDPPERFAAYFQASQGRRDRGQQRNHRRTWLDADQVRAGDALGLSKANRLKLRDVGQGEFYAFGPALGQPGVVHFCSDRVRTTHPRSGERHLLTAPAPSRAIRGVLGRFADLPQEAEDENRGLEEARRRIAELERQIKHLKGASGAQQSIRWPWIAPLGLPLSESALRSSGSCSRAGRAFGN